MRFYTLRHNDFISNTIEGEVAKFSPESSSIAPAQRGDEREEAQWKVGHGVCIPRFTLI